MNYINTKHPKHYKRVYVRTILRDIWEMEYTPAILTALLIIGLYILVTSKLAEYIVGGF